MDDQPIRTYRPDVDAAVAEREPALPPGDRELVATPPGIRPRETAPPPPPAPPRRSRWGSLLGWLIALLLVGAAIAWIVLRAAPQAPTGRFQSGGPLPVGTSTVATGDMPVILTALGTVTPLAIVTVKTQISGQLVEVAFKEGQFVNKGDFLAQIDPRPYQVALAQAQAQLAKDEAVLKNSQVDLQRYRTLVAQNSLARQTLDTQAATVQQNLATVQADQAQIDTQKLNLTYCRIVSPISGRVGLRQVDPGNYVQTSDANGIVVITQMEPLSVIFTLPEDNLQTVLRRTRSGAALQATAFDRTGTNKLDTGRLETIDNQIDTSTGTVKLRAVFENHEQNLFPNQFVNIQLLVETHAGRRADPGLGGPARRAGYLRLCRQGGQHRRGDAGNLGAGAGGAGRGHQGAGGRAGVVTDGADRLKDGAKVTLAGGGNRQNAGGDATPANPAPTAAPAAETAQPRQRGQGQGRRRSSE